MNAQTLFKDTSYLVIGMEESQYQDKLIARAFRANGYKATPQRIAICRCTLNSAEHCTAHMIYLEAKKEYPTISVSTVYTTLNILKDTGLIQELCTPRHQTRFDPNTVPHMHLICLQCGSITDWNDPIIPELIDSIAHDADFIVSGSCLGINGVCKECQNMNNNENK
jgi:Fur family peroxide stress response transcriptional regulator